LLHGAKQPLPALRNYQLRLYAVSRIYVGFLYILVTEG